MAGALNFQSDVVVDGSPIVIVIGDGGAGGFNNLNINGFVGITTWFGEFQAAGGLGGMSWSNNSQFYYGSGLPRSICNMITYDGLLGLNTFAYGGQAGLGNGGSGAFFNGVAGLFGAGGGATDAQQANAGVGGQGGHGTVMIEWS